MAMENDSPQVADSDWEEIMGKDLVLKRARHGKGELAAMGTVVKCNLRGFFVSNNICDTEPFEVWRSQQFKVGESDAVPGIEMAVRFSRVGDLLRVKFNSRFGYGSVGRPAVVIGDTKENVNEVGGADRATIAAIPPDTDLEYEIEVISHLQEGQVEPALLSKFPTPQGTSDDGVVGEQSPSKRHTERLLSLTELLQRKEAGNRWFSYGDFSRAARAYSKGTQVADRYFNGNANVGDSNAKALQNLSGTKKGGSTEEQQASLAEANAALAAAEREKEAQRRRFEQGDEELVTAYLSCLNNMAACQLRLGENGKAKEVCIRVLEMDPDNQKALLRAAKAALATHNYEECDMCLQRLGSVAPPGSSAAQAAAAEKRKLKQAQNEYRAQNKKMSANMARKLWTDGNGKSTSGGSSPAAPESVGAGAGAGDRHKEKEKGFSGDGTGGSGAAEGARSPPQAESAVSVPSQRAGEGSEAAGASSHKSSGSRTPAADGPETSPGTAEEPEDAASSAKPAATKTDGADRGLLLLLGTSLLVLLVSVIMLMWGPTTRTGETRDNA